MTDDLLVGDHVSRPKWTWTEDGIRARGDRLGIVVKVYSDTATGVGRAHTLYAVEWDDTHTIERGYLRIGLTKLPATMPAVDAPPPLTPMTGEQARRDQFDLVSRHGKVSIVRRRT